MADKLNIVVLSFEYLPDDYGNTIVKEVGYAVSHSATSEALPSSSLLFQPPYHQEPRNRTAQWLMRKHPGLEWNSGNIFYSDLEAEIRQLTEHADLVFCKGISQIRVLREILGKSALNLEDLGCPTWRKLPAADPCTDHKDCPSACAGQKARAYSYWLRDEVGERELLECKGYDEVDNNKN